MINVVQKLLSWLKPSCRFDYNIGLYIRISYVLHNMVICGFNGEIQSKKTIKLGILN